MSKRAKKGSAKWWTKRLDALWAKAVKAIGRCEWCGRKPPDVQLHADHIITRAKKSLRWNLRNGCSLCARCHLFRKPGDPRAWVHWIEAYRPDDVAYCETLQHKISYHSDRNYEAIEAGLIAALEERECKTGADSSRSSRVA